MKYRKLDIDPSKFSESFTFKPVVDEKLVGKTFTESTGTTNPNFVLPKIEAIHAGNTRNNTVYQAEKLKGDEKLKSGVYSFLSPYPKPVIYNHDVNTKATGRVAKAYYTEYTQAGRPGIIIIPKITDPEAIDGVLNERLMTVSIGGETNSAVCSVCGTDIINEGFCGHHKGESYDGQVAQWIIGDIYFDEVSWVNVPADSDAMVTNTNEVLTFSESVGFFDGKPINLSDVKKELGVEQTQIIESMNGGNNMEKELLEQFMETEEYKTLVSEKEALTEQLEQLKKEVSEKETSAEEAKTQLAEKEEALVAEQTKVAEAEAKVAEFEAKVQEMEKTIEALEAEKAGLEEASKATVAEHEELVAENARLATELHKGLAERVVDIRMSLLKEENREEALEKYVSRTTESLEDTLSDLLKEQTSVKTLTPVQEGQFRQTKVENPAQGLQESKKLSDEDVLISLFRNK